MGTYIAKRVDCNACGSSVGTKRPGDKIMYVDFENRTNGVQIVQVFSPVMSGITQAIGIEMDSSSLYLLGHNCTYEGTFCKDYPILDVGPTLKKRINCGHHCCRGLTTTSNWCKILEL